MSFTPRLRRWMGATLVAGLTVATLTLGSGTSDAATSLGQLSIAPTSGDEITTLTASTAAKCNAGDTGVILYISGPGLSAENIMHSFTALDLVNSGSGMQIPVQRVLREIWVDNAITAPSGVYTLRLACVGSDSFTETGQFSTTLTVTHPSGAANFESSYVVGTVAVPKVFVLKKKPTVTGTFKVGKTLTCKPGTWSPAPASKAYKWLRAGKAIKKATKATYKLVRADKGKKVGCQVTVKKSGYTNGVAKSAVKKVS